MVGTGQKVDCFWSEFYRLINLKDGWYWSEGGCFWSEFYRLINLKDGWYWSEGGCFWSEVLQADQF